jgi:hypothetical protein
MKKLFTLFLIALCLGAIAQPDDEIVYFTDSEVNDSRFALALNLNPYYTDIRLINDDATTSQLSTFSDEFEATGAFVFDYGMDLFYEIGTSFHVGIGIARSHCAYTWNDIAFDTTMPNILADNKVEVSMITVPIKVNFTTRLSDVFSLEVVPMVELNFLDSYSASLTYNGAAGAPADSTFNLNDRLKDVNWSVGIALGGTYWLTNEWGVFVRGSVRYLLNDMVQSSADFDWPRETLLNFGLNTGVRVRF